MMIIKDVDYTKPTARQKGLHTKEMSDIEKLATFWEDEENGMFINITFDDEKTLLIDTWKGKPGEEIGEYESCVASIRIDLRTAQITEGFNTRADLNDGKLSAIHFQEEPKP